jgi:hypothetical protein
MQAFVLKPATILHCLKQKKTAPQGEGPICLGSLWLGESVASALFVGCVLLSYEGFSLGFAQKLPQEKPHSHFGNYCAEPELFTPDVELPSEPGAITALFELIVARLLCIRVTTNTIGDCLLSLCQPSACPCRGRCLIDAVDGNLMFGYQVAHD